MRFKLDWASLIVGSKFTVFALFYFVFEDNFPGTSPCGGLHLEGRFNGGFFALPVWGLIFEGAYFGILRCTKTFAKIQDNVFFLYEVFGGMVIKLCMERPFRFVLFCVWLCECVTVCGYLACNRSRFSEC